MGNCSSSKKILPPKLDFDELIKILFVGDSGAGKSNLLLRIDGRDFNGQSIATVGVDYVTKICNWNDKKVKLQLWDTAGQERFRTITAYYYRGGQFVIYCFDLTDLISFGHLNVWMSEVNRFAPENIMPIVCGCKMDLERKVKQEDVTKLAKEIGALYVECSAKTGVNIDLLEDVLKNTYDRMIVLRE